MEFEKVLDRVYKEREDRHKFLNMGQMMFAAVNKKGKFEYVSDSWAKCLGLTKEQFQKMNFSLLIHPDDLDEAMDAYAFYQETGKFAVDMFYNRYRKVDGTYAWIQWFGGQHDKELGLSLTCAFELPEGQKGFIKYANGYEPFNWK